MNNETAGAILVMVLAAIGLIVLACVMYPTAAGAVQCHSGPDRDSYWTWRTVDGRRCWYRGHTIRPRSQLEWPKQSKNRGEKNQRKYIEPYSAARAQAPQENPPPDCCWPTLTDFDLRFIGE
jgi:hypothetical protein